VLENYFDFIYNFYNYQPEKDFFIILLVFVELTLSVVWLEESN
jgi:hypothetical protein